MVNLDRELRARLIDAGLKALREGNVETYALTQDPEFQESFAQMQRGEGTVIRPEEFDALEDAAASDEGSQGTGWCAPSP